MKTLTFSEFANMLYPFCGNGENRDDFVKTLTNKIMEGKPGRATKENHYKNPMMSKGSRDLQNYFKGTHPIPQRDASVILSCIGKYKFEQYLMRRCSDDAMLLLQDELRKYLKKEVVGDKQNVAEVCADLFAQILQELASIKTII